MTESKHDHEHDHTPAGCCGGHGHAHGPKDSGPEFTDAAGEHLASALRLSFRLLGAAMVLGVLAFLAVGFKFIRPGEVAIKTVFGRVVEVVPEGLAYNWPAPIGQIERISVGEQKVRIDDFWMSETPAEMRKDLRERTVPPGGLRPGYDGALLTGDRNLIHMRLECTYTITRVMHYRLNMTDGPETIQAVLCEAAIRAAGVRTADGLQRTERAAFERDAMVLAQEKLDELNSGILVRSVKVKDSTWPLATLADYDAAQSAVQQAETLKSQARGDAAKLLNSTAGAEAARRLVGHVGEIGSRDADPNANLVGQYDAAVARGDKAAAAELLTRIDNILTSEVTIGEARKLLTDASAYRTNTIEAVKRRVTDFEQRLAAYEANPSFAMNRWWDEAREEILSRPTVEKHYVREGRQKIVLKINRDLEIIRQTQRAFTEWLGKH